MTYKTFCEVSHFYYFEKINEKDVLYLVGISSENPEKIDAYKDDLKAICRKILASDIPNINHLGFNTTPLETSLYFVNFIILNPLTLKLK